MQIQELVDEYRKKTDEELLRLALDRPQLTAEAVSALTDELARRKIAAERLKAFGKEEERQVRKEAFRSKRRRARDADRWWFRIQLVAAYAIGLLVYHLLPFTLPKEWEDAALVTFLCTSRNRIYVWRVLETGWVLGVSGNCRYRTTLGD